MGFGDGDIIREAAGSVIHAQEAEEGAEIWDACLALRAVAATEQRIGDDSTTVGRVAHELMAEDQRWGMVPRATEETGNVGGTDAGGGDSDFSFIGSWMQARPVLNFQLVSSGKNESAHGPPYRTSRLPGIAIATRTRTRAGWRADTGGKIPRIILLAGSLRAPRGLLEAVCLRLCAPSFRLCIETRKLLAGFGSFS